MDYDIIGDIHGHADALTELLSDLGYRVVRGVWQHCAPQLLNSGAIATKSQLMA